MLVIGIDENGLGPLLGPMIVTAAAFETPAYDRERFWSAAGLKADDSKKLFSKSRLKSAEQATLAWLDAFGVNRTTHAALFDAVVHDPPYEMPCDHRPALCRPSARNLPAWADAVPTPVPKGEGEITPVGVRAFSICPGALNTAISDPGMNKFRLDFEMMIKLVKAFAGDYAGDVLALCGKVGSTRRYGPWLDGAGVVLWSALEEEPPISAYAIAGVGTVSFIRDADALHLPVAVASMVGKYLRELAMRDLNEALAAPGVRPASGYRDPVTKAFVGATAKGRDEIGLADACFIRNK